MFNKKKQTKCLIGLYAPQSYKNATDEEKASVCNGCGTEGWKGWIVPDTMWGLDISEACQIHDWMYWEGKTIEDKNEADRVFLNNLIRIIEAGSRWRIVKHLRMRRAFTYYQAVSIFGGPAFWASVNQKENISWSVV